MTRACIDLVLGLLISAVLVIAGCGGDSGDSGEGRSREPAGVSTRSNGTGTTRPNTPRKVTKPPLPKTGAARFKGTFRDRYDEARSACGAVSSRRLARDLGLRTSDPYAIAQTFTKKYQPAFREAVFDGCLAGLPDR